ncbi:MAG: addiction module protein [Byssovorax sp.]
MSHQEIELLASILRLPLPVRAELAHELLASLDTAADADVEDHWQAEVARRADDVLSGRAELEDADLVHEQLTARLRAAAR